VSTGVDVELLGEEPERRGDPQQPLHQERLDSVVIVNGMAAVLFMIGYILFGVAMIRTATLPRWSGVLVAMGAPAHLLGFGIAQLVSTAAWPIAILGSVSLGAGLAWPGYRLWRTPAGSDLLAANRSTQV
jgi:hypothetical protein